MLFGTAVLSETNCLFVIKLAYDGVAITNCFLDGTSDNVVGVTKIKGCYFFPFCFDLLLLLVVTCY